MLINSGRPHMDYFMDAGCSSFVMYPDAAAERGTVQPPTNER